MERVLIKDKFNISREDISIPCGSFKETGMSRKETWENFDLFNHVSVVKAVVEKLAFQDVASLIQAQEIFNNRATYTYAQQ